MRVLGVDPGSRITGWGLLSGTANRPRLIDCGTVDLPSRASFPERLHLLQCSFQTLVRRLEPTHAAVEAPYHGVSARSALQLAHARGVILATLASVRIDVAEYAPAAVKKAVTGNGRAGKDQVAGMVERLLTLPADVPRSPDLCDALAVALCDLAQRSFARAVERSVPR